MTKGIVIFGTLLTPFFFPFWATVLCTFVASFISPFMPLAVGVLLDTIYYTPQVSSIPLYSLLGLGATLVALLVHQFIQTSIIR